MKMYSYSPKLFLVFSLMLSGCGIVTTEPGTESVLVDKPYFFGEGGVRKETLKPGRSYTWISTKSISINTMPQRIEEKFDDLMTADTIPVDFDTAIQIQITDPVLLVSRYGKDWYANNIQRQYQSLVRDEARKYAMNELLTGKSVPASMEANVRKGIDTIIATNALPFRVTDISIGRAVPNKNVLEQIDQTAAQQQRSKTMVEATKAEKERANAEAARAMADNAYRQQMNLSPEQFLQLESIKKYSEACMKGANCSLIFGGQNTAMMLGGKK